MELLEAGVDCSVIALWFGHEAIETTQTYLHANLALKEAALCDYAEWNLGDVLQRTARAQRSRSVRRRLAGGIEVRTMIPRTAPSHVQTGFGALTKLVAWSLVPSRADVRPLTPTANRVLPS